MVENHIESPRVLVSRPVLPTQNINSEELRTGRFLLDHGIGTK